MKNNELKTKGLEILLAVLGRMRMNPADMRKRTVMQIKPRHQLQVLTLTISGVPFYASGGSSTTRLMS